MLILMPHSVFTLILLQIPPVSLKIPHTNSSLSFSRGLLCFAALSVQNMVESFWLSSFCLFLLSLVKEMSVPHYSLKPVLFAVFNNWRRKTGVVVKIVCGESLWNSFFNELQQRNSQRVAWLLDVMSCSTLLAQGAWRHQHHAQIFIF